MLRGSEARSTFDHWNSNSAPSLESRVPPHPQPPPLLWFLPDAGPETAAWTLPRRGASLLPVSPRACRVMSLLQGGVPPGDTRTATRTALGLVAARTRRTPSLTCAGRGTRPQADRFGGSPKFQPGSCYHHATSAVPDDLLLCEVIFRNRYSKTPIKNKTGLLVKKGQGRLLEPYEAVIKALVEKPQLL